MNTNSLVEWQRIDPENGLVEPWLTWPFMDWVKGEDWSDKNVIMFGAGLGDAWLAKKCKYLTVVERNEDWLVKAAEYAGNNGSFVNYLHRPCNDSDGKAEYYCQIPDDRSYDVIINDDAYRTELCQVAIDYFIQKKDGGIFVCDNFNQDFVWRSPKAIEIMSPYSEKEVAFYQPGHINHEGNSWNTRFWIING